MDSGTNDNDRARDQSNDRGSRNSLVGQTLDDRFRVEELIGSGGMSAVYRATQLRVNRDVAIKTLKVTVDAHHTVQERFLREINLLCSLNHPNIITVYDAFIGPDDQPCVVMDFLKGKSLDVILEKEGPMDVERLGRIMVQVCSALEYAHRKGIVHRDIKPGNIVMLDDEMDFVKVIDFGLAKFNQENRRLTHTGEIWGSPPYMSPEQCLSKPEDERSDLYSLGAVMYELLSGKDPFYTATSIFELLQAHVKTPVPPLHETSPQIAVPAKMETVIMKAMSKPAEDRYQSAAELRQAVADACLRPDDHVHIASAGTTRTEARQTSGAPVDVGLMAAAAASPANNAAMQAAAAAAGGPAETQEDLGQQRGISQNCNHCGKVVATKRKGTMTSWLLSGHYKAIEQVADPCRCSDSDHGHDGRSESSGLSGAVDRWSKPDSQQNVPPERIKTPPRNVGSAIADSAVLREPLFPSEVREVAKPASRYNSEIPDRSGNPMINGIVAGVVALAVVGAGVTIFSINGHNNAEHHQPTQAASDASSGISNQPEPDAVKPPTQPPAEVTIPSAEVKHPTVSHIETPASKTPVALPVHKHTPAPHSTAVVHKPKPAATKPAKPAAKSGGSPTNRWAALDKYR